ncbi:ankyrin repeat domain-containing protein [Candidatus Dependentiae bacterium]|nr:ankyrin repeat domain-containing protein [Candidatus Dependentiae bacterium]
MFKKLVVSILLSNLIFNSYSMERNDIVELPRDYDICPVPDNNLPVAFVGFNTPAETQIVIKNKSLEDLRTILKNIKQRGSFYDFELVQLAKFNPDDLGREMFFFFNSKCVITALIQSGANVNLRDENQNTPLHLSLSVASDRFGENYDVVSKYLIFYKADVNAENGIRTTPLHIATSRNDRDITKLLLAAKANVNVRNNVDATPLQISIKNQNAAIVEILIKAGADINAKDKFGRTPLDYAEVFAGDSIIKILKEKGAKHGEGLITRDLENEENLKLDESYLKKYG